MDHPKHFHSFYTGSDILLSCLVHTVMVLDLWPEFEFGVELWVHYLILYVIDFFVPFCDSCVVHQLCPRVCLCPVSVVSLVSMVVSFVSASSSVSVSNGLWCFLFCFVFIPCVLFSFVSFVSCIPSCLPSPHNPACRATVLVSLCSLSCSPSFLHAVRSCVFTLIPALF